MQILLRYFSEFKQYLLFLIFHSSLKHFGEVYGKFLRIVLFTNVCIMFVSCYVTGRESALESILKRADIEIFK